MDFSFWDSTYHIYSSEQMCLWHLTPELSRAAKRRRLGRIVRGARELLRELNAVLDALVVESLTFASAGDRHAVKDVNHGALRANNNGASVLRTRRCGAVAGRADI